MIAKMITHDDGDCRPETNLIFIIVYFTCVDAHHNDENRISQHLNIRKRENSI